MERRRLVADAVGEIRRGERKVEGLGFLFLCSDLAVEDWLFAGNREVS